MRNYSKVRVWAEFVQAEVLGVEEVIRDEVNSMGSVGGRDE